MGIIVAKFRKKKSTYEVLEKLEDEIKSIEQFKRNTEVYQKKIIRRFLVFAGLIYIVLLALLYFYFNNFTNNEKIIYLVPLLVLPIIIWFMKRILTWYYNKKIVKNQNKLVSLKEQKKKLIDNVMETETYKVAKTILDKFAPEPSKSVIDLTPAKKSSLSVVANRSMMDTELRQRYVPQTRGRLSVGSPITPMLSNRNSIVPKYPMVKSATIGSSMSHIPGTPLPMPRTVLPRDRSVLDRMVDYLVGDGPSNRFALICKQCNEHNGMALKEEFEYLAFKCCYCSTFNPARKKKPAAPKLESALAIKPASDSSDSDKNFESDTETSDDDNKIANNPIITEPEDIKDSDVEIKNSDTESALMDVDVEDVNNTVTSD